MKCDTVRAYLDGHFDEGGEVPDAACLHLQGCPKCAHYQARLESLERQLHTAPRVLHDPDLVARIQASLAAQPAAREVSRPLIASLAAAVVLVLAAGWFVDAGRVANEVVAGQWLPEINVVADWTLVRGELLSVPGAVVDATMHVVQLFSTYWAQGTAQLIALTGRERGMALVALPCEPRARRVVQWKRAH